MSYASFDNVNALLNGDLETRNLKQLADVCMAKADAVVDSYLGKVYNTPFTSPYPALVVSLAEDLAIYYLFRTGYFDGIAGNDKETVDGIWDKAIKQMMDIVFGKAVLPDVDPADADSPEVLAQIDSTTREYHAYADIGDERDWVPDSKFIDSIKDSKL